MTGENKNKRDEEKKERDRVLKSIGINPYDLTEADIKFLKQMVFSKRAWDYVLIRVRNIALWVSAILGAIWAFVKFFKE